MKICGASERRRTERNLRKMIGRVTRGELGKETGSKGEIERGSEGFNLRRVVRREGRDGEGREGEN